MNGVFADHNTFAIEALKKGVPVREVSKALGHSSITVTEKYYSKWCAGQQAVLDKALMATWDEAGTKN